MLRLLLDRKCLAVLIELHYAVFSGIAHIITEDGRAFFSGGYFTKHCRKALPVENIISQYQCHSVVTDEFRSDDKSIREATGFVLHRILETHAQLTAVSQ